jgi:uncharacterized membrane protein YphA (DoxX/SURF4 family)
MQGNLLSTLGRFVFAVPFAVSGVMHLVNGSQMAAMVPLPGGVFWVYFTGVALLAGSAGIATQILGKWAALGIALLMVTFIGGVHIPLLSNPQMAGFATAGIIKDTALAGAALSWAGFFARAERASSSAVARPGQPASATT